MKRPFFSYNSRNILHFQHQGINYLNINAKQVVDYPTPMLFYLHPKIFRRFFKIPWRLSQNVPSFF